MKDVVIRYWKEGDDEGIFELFDRTDRWVSNEAYHKKFDDRGLTPRGIVLAEMDGLIIAHLMGTRKEIMCEGEAKIFGGIGQVMVDKNYRGRGIGKAILQRIIQYHKDGNCRGILLWTQDSRIPAYPMYEKSGFRIAARRAIYNFQPGKTESSLSVEPYAKAFEDHAERVRQEWMRACFPVGIRSMKPADANWLVAHRNGQSVGYIHIGERDNIPFLSHAVGRLDEAYEICSAVFSFLAELGHKKAVWQTCVDSVWEAELHRRGFREGHIASDVRMCLPIGSPIDTNGKRPEFDGCSTW